MHRRTFLLASVTALTAGCAARNQETVSDEETTAETTGVEATTSRSETTTTERTTEQTAPSTRLKVRFETSMEAELTLKRLSDDEVVYEETRAYQKYDTVNLSGNFEADTDYKFAIFNESGEKIFERTVYDYEGYTIAVLSEDEAEVESHVEV